MKKISLIDFLGVVFCLFGAVHSLQADIVVKSKDADLKTFTEGLPGEKINLHSGKVTHYLETVSIGTKGVRLD